MDRRKQITAISLLLAAIPTMRWYALRLQDGGGELAGLVPLGAALWFAVRDRKGLAMTARGAWAGIFLLLVQAAAYPFLPAMIRALLMIAAVACVSGIWRKPGIVCLLVLALPWTASLDFFLGYPLRLLTSVNTAFLLETVGTEVVRSGVQLLYKGRVVGVDPACSGMNMLWSTGLLTGLLAAVFSLRWRGIFPLGAAALALALAGNSLRAAILFFPEAGIVDMPHILHAGIGVAIAGGCFFVLMKGARRLKEGLPSSARQPQPFPKFGEHTRPRALSLAPSPKTGRPNHSTRFPTEASETTREARVLPKISAPACIPRKPLYAASAAALLVLLSSAFSKAPDPQPLAEPAVLTSFQGVPVTRVALNEAEETFYRDFPGTIAVYEAGYDKIIVRQVNRATRKLHPASHCLRAEGFGIGGETVVEDGEDGRWLSYSISRNGEMFHVKEHITCPSSGRSWPEISAWFWHAFFHPGEGPWEAVTVISVPGNGTDLSLRH